VSRILLLLNRHVAPSETFQRSLAAGLADQGHDVIVYALRGDAPPAGTIHPGVRHVTALPATAERRALAAGVVRGRGAGLARIAPQALDRHGWTPRTAIAALQAGPIRALRPDAIHLGFSGIGVAMGHAWDLLDDIPLIVSCRGTDELVRAPLDPERAAGLGRLLQRATIVHCVAHAVADAAIELGADPATVRVIRPAVDLDAWPVAPRPASGPPWRLVTTTRLVPAKGLDDLLGAVAILAGAGHDVGLRVLGDGPHRDELRLRALRSGIVERIELVGEVAPDEVRRHLADAHLYVSPSLSEGISNGVLEAMASGVPVVSTDVGGMAEVISPGRDGWLAPPARPDLLAAAVAEALGSDRREAIGAAGRVRVEADLGRAQQLARWRELYAELLVVGGARGDDHPREDPTP
jgi:glycosyltransferase involved in cell wall biosynthesis